MILKHDCVISFSCLCKDLKPGDLTGHTRPAEGERRRKLVQKLLNLDSWIMKSLMELRREQQYAKSAQKSATRLGQYNFRDPL